jgi:hypothetical protein
MRPHGIAVTCVVPSDVDTPQFHNENLYKPSETHAVSGTVKPITAERVAGAIVHRAPRCRGVPGSQDAGGGPDRRSRPGNHQDVSERRGAKGATQAQIRRLTGTSPSTSGR